MHVCVRILILLFLCLTTLNNVVHIDHIMHTPPVPTLLPLPSPTLEFDHFTLRLSTTQFLYESQLETGNM